MVGAMMLMKILHCKRKIRKKKNKTPSPLYVEVGEQDPVLEGSSSQVDIKVERINPEYEQNLCRVCLKEGDIPIYGLKNLSEDLATFAAIEVSEFDDYPKFLCTSCSALLEGAILFRKTAQESDKSLRNLDFNPKSPPVASDNDTDTQDYSHDDLSYSYEEEKEKYKEKEVNKEKEELKINLDEREVVRSKSFHCRLCNLYFKTIEEYAEHRLEVGHDTKRDPCPICNKTYSSVYLKKHLALHRKETPYMCDVCGKKFKVQGQLPRHRMTHFIDDLPFKCPQCPYRGRFNESVRLHMRSHTGEKPYQCPQCPNKAFVNRSNLNKHLLTHKTDYDFQCNQCHRGFFKKHDLELHFKVDHTGIKDHVCNLCGKAFGYRKQMMKHQLKVHKRDKMRSGRTPLYVIQETQKKLEEETVQEPVAENMFI